VARKLNVKKKPARPTPTRTPAHTPPHQLTVSREALLVGGSDREFRALIHDALAFTSRLEAVRDGYAKIVGVTGIQYTMLVCISVLGATQSVTVKAVAEHLKLSGPFVTVEVGKLVSMGLVEKADDPSDRRKVSLSLTDEARARLAELAPTQRQVNDVHFGALTKSDFLALRRMMGELVESTDNALALLNYLTAGAG
jgi:DNA-binding MarR family transcriptional regulator